MRSRLFWREFRFSFLWISVYNSCGEYISVFCSRQCTKSSHWNKLDGCRYRKQLRESFMFSSFATEHECSAVTYRLKEFTCHVRPEDSLLNCFIHEPFNWGPELGQSPTWILRFIRNIGTTFCKQRMTLNAWSRGPLWSARNSDKVFSKFKFRTNRHVKSLVACRLYVFWRWIRNVSRQHDSSPRWQYEIVTWPREFDVLLQLYKINGIEAEFV